MEPEIKQPNWKNWYISLVGFLIAIILFSSCSALNSNNMKAIDWIVLIGTIGGIVAYGSWKGNQAKHSLKGFLLADRELPWYHILLSVMATQASAITFLSAPGQAYTDGMRFVQFYLGLPIAMIILSVTFIPRYYQLKVYTAYQF